MARPGGGDWFAGFLGALRFDGFALRGFGFLFSVAFFGQAPPRFVPPLFGFLAQLFLPQITLLESQKIGAGLGDLLRQLVERRKPGAQLSGHGLNVLLKPSNGDSCAPNGGSMRISGLRPLPGKIVRAK